MKLHFLPIYARMALVATAVLAMTACAHGPYDYYAPAPHHSPYVTYYDYWYYPAIGSYYDPRSHVYIYYEREHWIHARDLPHHLRPHLGRHVTVHSPHNRPYEEHHRHREQYRPERYRQTVSGEQTQNLWLGAPRREPPRRDHDRDDRRHDDGGRDRSHKESARDRDRDRHDDRSLSPAQRDFHEQHREYRRQPSATRDQAAPGRREPPASVVPLRKGDKAREREIRQDGSQTRGRNADGRPHGNGRRDDNFGLRDVHPRPDRPYWDDR